MAWAWIARSRREGPAMLALTRQKLPRARARRPASQPEDVWKGAYAVQRAGRREPRRGAARDGLRGARSPCDAAEKLRGDGVPARVVSMPCLELFLAQPEAYRRALVPDDGTPIVAVEAGAGREPAPLRRRRGLVYGIERFGASAPTRTWRSTSASRRTSWRRKVLAHVRRGGA